MRLTVSRFNDGRFACRSPDGASVDRPARRLAVVRRLTDRPRRLRHAPGMTSRVVNSVCGLDRSEIRRTCV